MNKSRKLSLINMIVNFAVIALEVVGIYLFITNPMKIKGEPMIPTGAEALKYYTVLTAIVTLLAAALMIWANIISFAKKRDCTPRIFYSMRFLSAVMSLLTLVTVIVFIYPEMLNLDIKTLDNFDPIDVIFGLVGGSLFVHFICPIISMVQFIGFEIEPKGKFRKTLEPFIGTLIYGLTILAIVLVKANKDPNAGAAFAPYFFFLVTPGLTSTEAAINLFGETNYLMNIGIAVSILVIAYVAGVILWALNRISHNIFIGEVIQAPAPKAKAIKGKKKAEPTKKGGNAFTRFVKNQVAFGDNSSNPGQTYHISYHDRRLKTWKVKTENAGRALKVFNTQKEAIDFANQCVKKNGGSIRVHSMMGRIRKE